MKTKEEILILKDWEDVQKEAERAIDNAKKTIEFQTFIMKAVEKKILNIVGKGGENVNAEKGKD